MKWNTDTLGWDVIDGPDDSSDPNTNFFYDAPWSDFIDAKGMVILEGEDITSSVTGDINIYMDAGIVAKTGTDDPFSAIDKANSITIHPDGTLDIGDADLTTAIATAALAKMTVAGGFARNGSTITAADITAMDTGHWPTNTVVLGGGGGGGAVTELANDSSMTNLQKVGNNTLYLLSGADNYIDNIIVDGGRLLADDNQGLRQPLKVTVNNDAEVEIGDDVIDPDSRTDLELNNQAVLDLQGHTYEAKTLTLGAGAEALLTGGTGTILDLETVNEIVAGTGALAIDNGATLKASLGGTAQFRVRTGGTLDFTSTTSDATAGLGSMQPDSVVIFRDNGTVNSGASITFDVDPDGTASDPDHTYEIQVATDMTATFDSNAWAGDCTFHTASYTDATGLPHAPVAYVEKTGDGTMVISDPNYDDNMVQPSKISWIVTGGTLDAGSGSAENRRLGTTAGGWLENDARQAPIASNHLEGIEVGAGATLIWGGLQGSLPAATWYPGWMPEDGSEGDGLLETEFIVNDTATIQGSDLVLGFYQEYQNPTPGNTDMVVDAYPLPMTVVTASPTTLNLDGQIELRSGLKLTDAGPLTVNVNGDVHIGNTALIDKAAAGLGVDVIDHLDVQTGAAGIYRSHTNMQTTQVAAGASLNIDPAGASGAAVEYAGTTTNDGGVSVQSGDVTLTGDLTNNAVATFGGDTVHLSGTNIANEGRMNVTSGVTTIDNQMTSTAAPGSLFQPGLTAAKLNGNQHYGDLPSDPSLVVVLPDLQDVNVQTNGGGPTTFLHDGSPVPTIVDPTGYTKWDGQIAGDQCTWVYEGDFLADADGVVNFREHFDDESYLVIDGAVLLDDTGWNNATETGSTPLAMGWHAFHVAFVEIGGGFGPPDGNWALAYDSTGGTAWGNIPPERFRTASDDGGILSVSEGAVCNADGGFTGFNGIKVGGTLSVGGTSDVLEVYNTGILEVQTGASLDVSTTIHQVAGTSLLEGNWVVKGTLGSPAGTDIQTISAPTAVTLDGAASSFAALANLASIEGALTVTGGKTFTTVGALDNTGTVTVGDSSTLVVSGDLTMYVAGGASIDCDGGNLIVDYTLGVSPFSEIEGWVVSGYNGGTWDGPGIASSEAAGDGKPTGLAVADNTDTLLGLADLEGVALDGDGSDVLVKFTWYGDVNLDGVVDAADYAVMDQSWNNGTQSPAGGGAWRWACGDVNYDGIVDAGDYALIDGVWNNYNAQVLGADGPAPVGSAGGMPTPEPATLALLGLGAAAMLARRRHGQSNQ